jgi:hypothetical protein
MGFTMTGVAAEVRWAYKPAARLGAWTLTADAVGTQVTATVIEQDDDRMLGSPLYFVVPRDTLWKWPVYSASIVGGTLTATLGPQE